jgi:hypothetical protein
MTTPGPQLARRDLHPDDYPEFADAPFLPETLELFRSVRHHDLATLTTRCDDDFGIVDIDTDGSSRLIRTRDEWVAWFRDLFARLDDMAATTDTEVTAYDAMRRGEMGFSVVEFRQLLHADGQTAAFDCVVTIVWKWQEEAWREARWHASLLAGPTPV